MSKFLVWGFAVGALLACSKQDLSYEYSLDVMGARCTTGQHSFSSKEEMCAGLKNHDLNQNCARKEREDSFKSNGCEGKFE